MSTRRGQAWPACCSLFLIAQFIAYFDCSNIAEVVAVQLGDILEHLNLATLAAAARDHPHHDRGEPLIPAKIAKWAVLAPIFVPLTLRLGVEPQTVVAATTRAEILAAPSRVGGAGFTNARNFVDGCATVPVTSSIADDAAALKARHRALSLPDAIALAVADLVDADAVWTFDRRWSGVDSRVCAR